jgi:hypothetical protein
MFWLRLKPPCDDDLIPKWEQSGVSVLAAGLLGLDRQRGSGNNLLRLFGVTPCLAMCAVLAPSQSKARFIVPGIHFLVHTPILFP